MQLNDVVSMFLMYLDNKIPVKYLADMLEELGYTLEAQQLVNKTAFAYSFYVSRVDENKLIQHWEDYYKDAGFKWYSDDNIFDFVDAHSAEDVARFSTLAEALAFAKGVLKGCDTVAEDEVIETHIGKEEEGLDAVRKKIFDTLRKSFTSVSQ